MASVSVEASAWTRRGRVLARLPRLVAEARRHPAWLPVFVAGRLLPVRRAMRWMANRHAGVPQADTEVSPAEAIRGPTPTEVVAALRADGIATGLALQSAILDELRAYAASGRTCHGGAAWDIRFTPEEQPDAERRHGVPLLVGHYGAPDLDCPAVATVARDRLAWQVARGYLGPAARLIDIRLWWSFPSARPRQRELAIAAQDNFHFDLSDWGELKLFFYVTDVGPENGPHRFVRGSHRRRGVLAQLSPFVTRSEAWLRHAYGAEAIQDVTGPAGSGIAEDPFGFHTGSTLRAGRRLMLELSFGVTGVRARPHLARAALQRMA
ncbi:phytanoyl-CoA dioxygenase family protein [Falsiroseomonas oryzae]|uniref:hypothetical protein n=1 Tax=Falsiroseomonas oryzae TaxID=2766473 RepID=UPI0022EA1A92|nr:hypothetical protein [Roseomonas sp. MO-31]